MTNEEIHKLIESTEFPEPIKQKQLIETHISWVILCDNFVYKIKKPMKYSFLDFSSLELRKYYCEREVTLNNRLTTDLYLEVVPICKKSNSIALGGSGDDAIDFAVKMKKLDGEKQMDKLLGENKVRPIDIENLAVKIADFHQTASIIDTKDVLAIRDEFNDLASERDYVSKHSGVEYAEMIDRAVTFSNNFVKTHSELFQTRLTDGFYRDCHGDLHSRNIFLLPEPVPFDCIEFNDDFRQIDLLNEIAFLCMDLDAAGKSDFATLFLKRYNSQFPVLGTQEEQDLFVYYKAYRANVRAKVNSLRARSAATSNEKSSGLAAAEKYLSLMNGYMDELIRN